MPIPPKKIFNAIYNKYFQVEKWQESYTLSTSTYRRISKYTGLNFNQIDKLPYSKYLLYNRDSWIESYTENEEGLKFLKDLWRLQQTESDDNAISGFKRKED